MAPDLDDGIVIDPASIRTEVMRAGDEYQGVRCKLVAGLGRARIPFALDISFGDPGASTTIALASVLDQPDVRLRAYPLALNLAEKIVTAMQRRETSTRDRDFADLWACSRRFDFEATELLGHIRDVARHRQQAIMPLAEALANMPDRQQPYAAMVRRMAYLAPPPEHWTDLIAGVVAFVDPLLSDEDRVLSRWSYGSASWACSASEWEPILRDHESLMLFEPDAEVTSAPGSDEAVAAVQPADPLSAWRNSSAGSRSARWAQRTTSPQATPRLFAGRGAAAGTPSP